MHLSNWSNWRAELDTALKRGAPCSLSTSIPVGNGPSQVQSGNRKRNNRASVEISASQCLMSISGYQCVILYMAVPLDASFALRHKPLLHISCKPRQT